MRCSAACSPVNFMFTGTSGTLGEFRAGAGPRLFGAFTSVLVGGIGAIAVACCG